MKIGRFALGFGAALRGLARTAGNADLRATYRHLVLAIFVLAVILDAAGFYALWIAIDSDTVESGYIRAVISILQIVGTVITLIAAPVIAMFLVNAMFPVLADRVFLAALKGLDPSRAQLLTDADGLPLSAAVMGSLRRLCVYVGLTVVFLLLSLIPFIGPVIGGVGQLWVTARMLGWELLDPYLDRRGMDHASQRSFVKEHNAAIAGFAVPWTFMLGVPIVGPLLFGIAQGAAATLVHDVIEKDDQPEPSAPAEA